MKRTLLISFIITGVCFGQTYDHIEFYDDGISPKVIRTYKVSKGKIELFKKTEWYYDGQKAEEGTYKGVDSWGDPKKVGVWISWSYDGKESSELIYKDGAHWDGKWTDWDENGQKRLEGIFKNGVLIEKIEY